MTVHEVARNEVVALWHRVEPLLSRAFAIRPAEYSLDQLKTMLVTGNQVLLVSVDDEVGITGAATVSALLYPNETVAFITCLAGEAVSNPDVYTQLQNWARSRAFTCIQGCVSESVARLFRPLGFVEKYRVIEAKL